MLKPVVSLSTVKTSDYVVYLTEEQVIEIVHEYLYRDSDLRKILPDNGVEITIDCGQYEGCSFRSATAKWRIVE